MRQPELVTANISPAIVGDIPERGRRTIAAPSKVTTRAGKPNLKKVSDGTSAGLFTGHGVYGAAFAAVIDPLYQAELRARSTMPAKAPNPHDRIEGRSHITQIIDTTSAMAHPALESRTLYRGVHADPRMVRRPARGKARGPRSGAVFPSRQGRRARPAGRGRGRHQR